MKRERAPVDLREIEQRAGSISALQGDDIRVLLAVVREALAVIKEMVHHEAAVEADPEGRCNMGWHNAQQAFVDCAAAGHARDEWTCDFCRAAPVLAKVKDAPASPTANPRVRVTRAIPRE